jgi:hypothetical protein
MSDIIVNYDPFHSPICNKCKHHIWFLKCKAFDKIPDDILDGDNNHEKPLEGQKGDFVFTPKDK